MIRLRGVLLVVLVAVGAPVVPRWAPPAAAVEPYRAEGRSAVSIPGSDSVTNSEFLATCPKLPASQGLDAWVFELPQGLDPNGAVATVTASNAADDYDLEMAEYGLGTPCRVLIHKDAASRDLTVTLRGGTRFVSVLTRVGVDTTFFLTVTPTPVVRPSYPLAPRRSYPAVPDDPIFNTPQLSTSPDSAPVWERHYGPTVGQWNLRKIEAPEAWQLPQATGHGVVVAVIDTGVDLEHEDLQCPGKLAVLPGSNMGSSNDDRNRPDDANGHGTHVAGIVGACTDNGTGVAGVAPDATIMPVRIVNGVGSIEGGVLSQAIRFAADNGAHVINISSAGPPYSVADRAGTDLRGDWAEAIRYARSLGTVVVAAAGNDTLPFCEDPALLPGVICVGATARDDAPAEYSNWAGKLSDDAAAVMAPGGTSRSCEGDTTGIVSTYVPIGYDCDRRPAYDVLTGTSMASPHVAGVAALVYDRLNAQRTADNAQRVVDAILHSADDLLLPGYDATTGYGRVNARKAVASVEPVVPAVETTLAFAGDSSTTGQYSDSTYVAARLTDADGAPMAGQPVSFVWAGAEDSMRTTATTDGAGVASARPGVTVRPGDYRLTAVYSGAFGEQTRLEPSQATVGYTVVREDAALDAVIMGRGPATTISAGLADADDRGAPIAGAPVTLFTDDHPTETKLTDEDGRVVFALPAGARHKRHRVVFAGDEYFTAAVVTVDRPSTA